MGRSEETDLLEKRIDAAFEVAPVPAASVNAARWAVCTAGEDVQRFALRQVAAQWAERDWRTKRGHWIGQLDRYKYALKHALALCEKKCVAGGDPFLVDEEAYVAASELLFKASADFAIATRIFSSVRASGASLVVDPVTGRNSIGYDERVSQYHSLELLLDVDRVGFSPTMYTGHLFAEILTDTPLDSAGFDLVNDIAGRVRLAGGDIEYSLITRLVRALFDELKNQGSTLPEGWTFPWGDAATVRAFYLSLQARCLYHLIAVHVGAGRLGLRGLGWEQICLNLTVDELLSQVTRIADIPRVRLKPVVDALTLGADAIHSDPALQPLVPIGQSRLAIPNMLVLSSDWERNMLSLQARVSKKTFDAQSMVFEKLQIAEIVRKIPDRYAKYANLTLKSARGESEEIDLMLLDHSSKTALICELRWFLQPGDVREVINRKKEILRKVSQLQRKIALLADPPMPWLKPLVAESSAWTIRGVVVIDGFGGIPSNDPNRVPVVPVEIFDRVVGRMPSLEHVQALLCSPLWLPKPRVDFLLSNEPYDILGEKFDIPVINLGERSYMSESLPKTLAEAADVEPSRLRAVRW